MSDECFVIYERKATKKGMVNQMVGYSKSPKMAIYQLSRLYHMNTFENKFFMEVAQYKPVDAYCFDE